MNSRELAHTRNPAGHVQGATTRTVVEDQANLVEGLEQGLVVVAVVLHHDEQLELPVERARKSTQKLAVRLVLLCGCVNGWPQSNSQTKGKMQNSTGSTTVVPTLIWRSTCSTSNCVFLLVMSTLDMIVGQSSATTSVSVSLPVVCASRTAAMIWRGGGGREYGVE